jgi:hypothetical protein
MARNRDKIAAALGANVVIRAPHTSKNLSGRSGFIVGWFF